MWRYNPVVEMGIILLNKNTLGVKNLRGQSEAALQIGSYMCDQNFDISLGQDVIYQKPFY